MWISISNETSTGETEPLTEVIGSTPRATAATAARTPAPGRRSRNGSRIKVGCATPGHPALEQKKRAAGGAVPEPRLAHGLPRETLGHGPQREPPARDLQPEIWLRGLQPAMPLQGHQAVRYKLTGPLPPEVKTALRLPLRDQALPPSIRVVREEARLAVVPVRAITVTAALPAAAAALEARVVAGAVAVGVEPEF